MTMSDLLWHKPRLGSPCCDSHVTTNFVLQAKVDASTLDSRGQVIKFDVYQNAVAMALQCVASKLNWNTMWSTSEGRGQMRGGAEKSIQSLMSLLAWQLATFWDNMQKVNAHSK